MSTDAQQFEAVVAPRHRLSLSQDVGGVDVDVTIYSERPIPAGVRHTVGSYIDTILKAFDHTDSINESEQA